MNLYKKILLLISIGCLTSCSPKKFELHECDSVNAATSCASTCSPSKDKIQFEFLPDKNLKKVMVSVYTDGKYTRSFSADNCSIFDNSNWTCSTEMFLKNYNYQMAKGIFTGYFVEDYSSLRLCAK